MAAVHHGVGAATPGYPLAPHVQPAPSMAAYAGYPGHAPNGVESSGGCGQPPQQLQFHASFSQVPDLTAGLPDPSAIERQKASYMAQLSDQEMRTQASLDTQKQQHMDYIKAQAEKQERQLFMQIDQQVKQQEMALTQQYNQQLLHLNQQYHQQKAALEQQAMQLTMEYQQRSMQDEMMRKQLELQREQYEVQARFQQDLQQLQQYPSARQHHAPPSAGNAAGCSGSYVPPVASQGTTGSYIPPPLTGSGSYVPPPMQQANGLPPSGLQQPVPSATVPPTQYGAVTQVLPGTDYGAGYTAPPTRYA